MKYFVALHKDGGVGTKHIVGDDFDVDAWAVENAADLVALGFIRVVECGEYVPTRAYGDKRTVRR